jgi:hypothetical protein
MVISSSTALGAISSSRVIRTKSSSHITERTRGRPNDSVEREGAAAKEEEDNEEEDEEEDEAEEVLSEAHDCSSGVAATAAVDVGVISLHLTGDIGSWSM